MPRCILRFSCVLIFMAGCGSSEDSVSGTVTYQDRPLNFGWIRFTINRGETARSARIQPDGTYVVEDLPAGEAQLSVVVPPAIQGKPDDPTAPGFDAFVPTNVDRVMIPKRYSKISTSGLTLTVTTGPQTHNINLE